MAFICLTVDIRDTHTHHHFICQSGILYNTIHGFDVPATVLAGAVILRSSTQYYTLSSHPVKTLQLQVEFNWIKREFN